MCSSFQVGKTSSVFGARCNLDTIIEYVEDMLGKGQKIIFRTGKIHINYEGSANTVFRIYIYIDIHDTSAISESINEIVHPLLVMDYPSRVRHERCCFMENAEQI